MKKISLYFEEAISEELRIITENTGVPAAHIIREAVKVYLSSKKEKFPWLSIPKKS